MVQRQHQATAGPAQVGGQAQDRANSHPDRGGGPQLLEYLVQVLAIVTARWVVVRPEAGTGGLVCAPASQRIPAGPCRPRAVRRPHRQLGGGGVRSQPRILAGTPDPATAVLGRVVRPDHHGGSRRHLAQPDQQPLEHRQPARPHPDDRDRPKDGPTVAPRYRRPVTHPSAQNPAGRRRPPEPPLPPHRGYP